MTKTLTAAVSAVLLIMLTACSSGSDSSSSASSSASSPSASSPTSSASGTSDEAIAASSISASLVQAQRSSGAASALLAVNRQDANCIGSGFVDKLGIAKLQEYKLLTKDLKANASTPALKMSPSDAATAATVATGCTDIKSRLVKAVTSTGSLPKKAVSCIKSSLKQSDIQAALTAAFQGDQSGAQQKVAGPLLKCSKVGSR